jgi:hypothetical protein
MSYEAYIVEIQDPYRRTLVVMAENSGRAYELTDEFMMAMGEPKYKVTSVRKAHAILTDSNVNIRLVEKE